MEKEGTLVMIYAKRVSFSSEIDCRMVGRGVIDLDKQAERDGYSAKMSFSNRVRPRKMKTLCLSATSSWYPQCEIELKCRIDADLINSVRGKSAEVT